MRKFLFIFSVSVLFLLFGSANAAVLRRQDSVTRSLKKNQRNASLAVQFRGDTSSVSRFPKDEDLKLLYQDCNRNGYTELQKPRWVRVVSERAQWYFCEAGSCAVIEYLDEDGLSWIKNPPRDKNGNIIIDSWAHCNFVR